MNRLLRRLKLLSRRSKTEASDTIRPSQEDRWLSRSPALPPGGRRYGYNGRSTPMGGRARYTPETELFLENMSTASLSHFLIWYIYYDVVPPRAGVRGGYGRCDCPNLMEWIRLGLELRNATAMNNARQVPRQLLAIIHNLKLEEDKVMGKLLRLSDAKQMEYHELGEDKLENSSSWLAAGDRMDANQRILENLRPVSGTVAADCRDDALEWVNAFLEFIIRPKIDGFKFPEDSRSALRYENAFRDICGRHAVSLDGKAYDEALEGIGWERAHRMLAERAARLSDSERSWFAKHRHIEYSATIERSARRQSAPLLHDAGSLIAFGGQILVYRERRDDAFCMAMPEQPETAASMQTSSAQLPKGKQRMCDEPTSQQMIHAPSEDIPQASKRALFAEGARDELLARTGSHGSTRLKRHHSNPDLSCQPLLSGQEYLLGQPADGCNGGYTNDSEPLSRGANGSAKTPHGKNQDHSSSNKRVSFIESHERSQQSGQLRPPPRAQDRPSKQPTRAAAASSSKASIGPPRSAQNTTVNAPSAKSASLSKSRTRPSRSAENATANYATATASSASKRHGDGQAAGKSDSAPTDDLGEPGVMWKEYDESQK